MRRLHLVDGTYELFRAHYSKRPPRSAPDGRDVKATVGVMASLLALLADADEAVTHLAVAFDNPVESFRNDLFDGYKTGEGLDPALASQFDLVEEATAAIGIVVWSMDTYEADDALATAAALWRDSVDQVRILTPDKDLGQAVIGNRVVLVDRMRDRVIDETGVCERFGVPPTAIPDWLALVGDTADGIPGLAGFGAKTAATLLARYGSIEAIPDDPAMWTVSVRGATRLGETLRSGRGDAALYKRLATLVHDVPLPGTIDDLAWAGADRARMAAISRRVGELRLPINRWRTTAEG